MSLLNVNAVEPSTGTDITLGASGDTTTVPSGATLDISSATLTPPATMPASSGINLTALNATNLGSGTVPTARLGTGSASSSVFLAGDSTWIAAGGGKIGQVVMGSSEVQIYSTSSSDDLISQAITPVATSSSVLVTATLFFGTNMNPNGGIKLLRDSTALGATTTGQFDGAVGTFWSCDDFSGNDYTVVPFNFTFLDTGISTTSSTTYKFTTSSFSILYLNRALGAASGYARSTITLMEVLA